MLPTSKDQVERMGEVANRLLESSKGYEVILSTKDRVKCDSDELQRVVEGIRTGSMIKVRQAFINPSFIVTIVLDEKRIAEFAESVEIVRRKNYHNATYSPENTTQEHLPAFKLLRDIFQDTQLSGSTVPRTAPLGIAQYPTQKHD